MNPDYVAYLDGVNENSIELLSAFDKAKSKIVRYFKVKVQNFFMRNSFLTSFDNHFSAFLNERVLILYKYVTSIMNRFDGFFLFNKDIVLQMDFYSFVKIILLRLDFQFLEICGLASENHELSVDRKNLEACNLSEYEDINARCIEFAKNTTVEQVLSRLPQGSEQRQNFYARIGVFEFEKTLFSLIKFNIFEGFSDDKFFYFEAIENIDNYTERMLLTIPEKWPDSACNVPYPVRKVFHEKLMSFQLKTFMKNPKN